jgi:type II secretory pathway predicted ATPase ExeA
MKSAITNAAERVTALWYSTPWPVKVVSAMTAEAHFNFRRTPFEKDVPTGALYIAPKTHELLSRLEYAAQMRKFAVIIGGVGVGKTTAIRKFTNSLDAARFRCIYIADSALKPRVFYWEILTQLANGEKPSFYRSECKRRMQLCMQQLQDGPQIIPVVIIDEAHTLSHEMLEETRFLLNIDMDSRNPMALIIVAQNELRSKLSKDIYEPIAQRIDFRFILEPFDRSQTLEYIASHMRYAGGDGGVFTDTAVDAVYAYSNGYARKINKACSLALLYATQRGKRAIDGADIDFIVDQELSW